MVLPPSSPPAAPQRESSAPAVTDRLWEGCLSIARARREGRLPGADPIPGWTWSPADGWQPACACDAPAQAFAALYKPLLDVPAGSAAWTIGQLGQSLDGFVATCSGDSDYVNGPQNLDHVHRLRALSDAVIVGAGTVAADDPRLTTRRVSGPDPRRVVLDPHLRLQPPHAQVLRDAHAPALWLCDARHAPRAPAPGCAAEVLPVAGLLRSDGSPDMPAMVAALHARGLRVLFVEGGGVTVSRCLQQGVLQRLHLAVAPVLIGNGRPGLRFDGPARMADCLRPRARVYAMGADQLWDLEMACRGLPPPAPDLGHKQS